MATDSGPTLGQRALRAAGILLFVAWAIAEAMRLLTSVWVQLVVVGSIVGLGVAAWYWHRRRL